MISHWALVVFLWLLKTATTQNSNCDYYQQVQVGQTYTISSRGYPNNYTGEMQCRWVADCPSGYNIRMDCREILLPQTPSCSGDRLLVSKSGDTSLTGAESYCGRGSLTAVSNAQRMVLGLITTNATPGGRFICTISAQAITPSQTCTCGLRKQNRIVGGQETLVNEFPMMVGIVDADIGQIRCGGVIISNKHVLTAAHCVKGLAVDRTAVIVGEHDVSTGADTSATKGYRVSSFTSHPLFTEQNYDYDIAIVTVVGEIAFNNQVGPVCLPFKFRSQAFAGKKVTVTGWGTLFIGGPDSKVLRKVDLDVIGQTECRYKVPTVTERQMCTFTQGKDACQDDSGGPALYTDPQNGLLYSVGIVSYGQSCASNSPGINTRITSLLDWIVANTRVSFCMK